MKNNLLILLIALFVSGLSYAQPLTGIKSIPGDYSTVEAAIADLNAQNVGAGGVTFNIAANYVETFTSPSAGSITTLTGSATQPIVFKKSGSGLNPVITAAVGIGTMDAVFTISGCDYVTFDGINVVENPLNTNATSQMEWGFAILKNSESNGSQNITISNCNISLNIAYTATVGIYANNHTVANTTVLPVNSISGTNSNLKIYSNKIDNCYSGISVTGYNDIVAPYTYLDQNNEIGKDGANTITNVAGQTATPAVAGYGIYGKSQNNLIVANNIITSTMGGNGSPSGIYLTSANNGSYELYGNTVNFQFNGTGTVSLNAIFSDMGASASSGTTNIYNNTVSGCTYPTLTTGTVYFMSLTNLGTNVNVYGNNVTNNSTGSASVVATGTIRYLQCQVASTVITTGSFIVHDNVISGNTRTQSIVGGGGTNFLYVGGKASSLNMFNNQVINNVIGSNGTANLIYSGTDAGSQNVYDNLIENISKAEGQTYGITAYNVTSGSGPCHYYRNTIRNIEGLGASVYIYGFNIVGSHTYNIYNNMAGDFRAPATSGTTTSNDRLFGCYSSSSVTLLNLFNNTIYLNNTSTGANFGSAALSITGSATKSDIRNNILVNTSTPSGTGRTVVVRFPNTSLTNFQATSNYNNLYAGTPSANKLIFYNGTTGYQTLNDYKTLVYPRELQSVTEMPPFISIASGSTDLHLQNEVATQCEAGGISVSSPVVINTDYDTDPRFPSSGYPVNDGFTPNAPDIGADEIGGLPNDITGPAITYTPLSATNLTTNRILTATITDGSGIPTSGTGLPVLYWQINSGAWLPAVANWVSGSTYSFAFGAGTSVGDLVSYYIVAQDNATIPNATSYPLPGASGFSINPPSCSTPPVPPSTYTVMQGISGVYHVGVGKDYTTITAAAIDISTKFISGPLTLLLDDPTYPSETFPINFVSNPGSSSTNTLTLRPNEDMTTVISGSVPTGLFDLNGIDYFTIDGSNKSSNTRDLSIVNNETALGNYTISIRNSGGSNPVTNVTIKNCNIRIKPIHASAGNSAIMVPNTGGGHENVIFDNNHITSAFDAISIKGVNGNILRNFQITNNLIGSIYDSIAVTRIGIYLEYADNTVISNNEIMGPPGSSLNTGQTGVYLGPLSTNTKVQKNKIHTFWRSSDDGWGVSGLWFATSDASTVTEISNNLIYDIHSPGINPGVGQNITYGMFFRSGGNVKIIHNSISLTGAYLSPAASWDASSACLGFYYQATGGNFEIRNNILRNSMTTLGGGAPGYGKAYGIMISTPPSMFSIINNNDYFIDGTNAHIAQKYTNGLGIEFDFPTLASWQAYTAQEANSLTIDPQFTSPSNLFPTTTAMNNAGSYIPGVPTDFAGTSRSNPPDIGAYEFAIDPVVVTSSATAVTYQSATVQGMVNAANYDVNTYYDYGTSNSYGYTVAASPSSVSGSSNTAISANLSGLLPSTVYHYRARGLTTSGLTMYGEDMTFTTSEASIVTMNVDMLTAAGFTPGSDQVYLAGNFPGAVWNEPGTNPALLMTQVGTTLTYTLALVLPNGTYEYKYFKNAGWDGGEYTGGSNRLASVSGNTTINDTWGGSINWANLQWPGTGSINIGDAYDVYAQAYIPNGITSPAGATYGLQAWIGYSTTNSDPNTWTNWVSAPFFGQSGDNDEFKADLGTAITSAGTYYYATRFQFGNSSYVYGGFNGGFWNGTTNISGILTINAPATKTLNLKLFLEGLYVGSGLMSQAQGSSGSQFGTGIADQVTIELHNATSPYAMEYSYENVNLLTDGMILINSLPGTISGNYYIVVKNRNSIETWSATAIDFSAIGTISYDFSTAVSQAFGNNLKLSGTDYLIWGGDATQDGIVDGSDMAAIDNASTATLTGYNAEDVNGDGIVDGSDMAMIDNNSTITVQISKP